MSTTPAPLNALNVLVYIKPAQGNGVLMVHHTRPDPHDTSFGKFNGLYGCPRSGEHLIDCARRLVHEETGLGVKSLRFRGTVQWCGFGSPPANLLGAYFIVDEVMGTPLTNSRQGPLHWVPVDALLRGEFPLWPGDLEIFPRLFSDDPSTFHGVLSYEQGTPSHWRGDTCGS